MNGFCEIVEAVAARPFLDDHTGIGIDGDHCLRAIFGDTEDGNRVIGAIADPLEDRGAGMGGENRGFLSRH